MHPVVLPNLPVHFSDTSLKHATSGLHIVVFSGILSIGSSQVAYGEKHTHILLHMRGDPMTLPDRIERTLVLPVPRQRVWDAIPERAFQALAIRGKLFRQVPSPSPLN